MAFFNCNSLTSVTILNPGTVIGNSANPFVFSTWLSDLVLKGWEGSTAESFAAAEANIGFESLGTMSGQCGDNVYFTINPATGGLNISGSGQMWDYEETGLTSPVKGNRVVRTVNISDGVTSIGSCFFCNCSKITEVVLPVSVSNISAAAFYGCTSLSGVTILNAAAVIGDSTLDVFEGCPSGLVIRGYSGSTAQTYAELAGHTFEPIMGAADFVLPADLTVIEAEAFYGDTMTSAYIPDTVDRLGSKAFAYCTSLTQIRIPGGISVLPPDIFQGVPKSQLTIFGTPGSAAEAFATRAGIRFVAE